MDRYFATVTDYSTDVEQCRLANRHPGRAVPTGADISTSITRYPRILLLVLKRYRQTETGERVKDMRSVRASVNISLQRFHYTGTADGSQYKLAACCSHSGSGVHGGHYIATVLVPSTDASAADQWIHMNDATATVDPTQGLIRNVPTQAGFNVAVLLYEQCQPL